MEESILFLVKLWQNLVSLYLISLSYTLGSERSRKQIVLYCHSYYLYYFFSGVIF